MVHPIVDGDDKRNHLHLHLLQHLHYLLTLLTRGLLLQIGLLEEAIDACMRLGNKLKSYKLSKRKPKVLPFDI